MEKTALHDLAEQFALVSRPRKIERFGSGHINDTYRIFCVSGESYILQKINTKVFTHPVELMENIAAVTDHLSRHSNNFRSTLHVIPTRDEQPLFVDDQGEYWRMYDYITDSICLQKVESPEDFYSCGRAFGKFQRKLDDFPADTLHVPIPDFHNTRERYRQFRAAMDADPLGRAAACREEIAFALAREDLAGTLVDMLADGRLPLRVTHNDTKLDNILFDRKTRFALCVIDLDTVMPGSALYDFGDAIRFGASTAAEDEQDLELVACDMQLFEAYTRGFLDGCDGKLTDTELELLPFSAKLITLECGVRFLTDYLLGDTYFRTKYAEHNLVRARTQFKLVADMEKKYEEMKEIVRIAAKK